MYITESALGTNRELLFIRNFFTFNFVLNCLVDWSFNFIQQKSPTSVSGEMNAYWYSIQWGCHRFSEGIYRAKLDKIWAQIRQGAFDKGE